VYTILVIDDDVDYRENLTEILEFENYKALTAENGLIGLEMVRQHGPNLIVCDVDMPVMNGIEVLKAVKADPTFAKIPFIVATGSSDSLTVNTAYELGAESCLAKPVSIPGFLAAIGALLQ